MIRNEEGKGKRGAVAASETSPLGCAARGLPIILIHGTTKTVPFLSTLRLRDYSLKRAFLNLTRLPSLEMP
jgi:hypothetical protein